MSGGQKQRVASARAMITNPSLILADEPTGALDSKAARMLLDSMETMNVELNATILMVTHDAFTASYCKRILFIKDGKIFNELVRGNDSRKRFFDRIIGVWYNIIDLISVFINLGGCRNGGNMIRQSKQFTAIYCRIDNGGNADMMAETMRHQELQAT